MNEELLTKVEELLTATGHDLSRLKYRVRRPAEWVGGMTMKNNQQVWDRQAFLDQCKNELGKVHYTLHVENEKGLDLLTLKFHLIEEKEDKED